MCPVFQVLKKRNYSVKQAEKVNFAFQAYHSTPTLLLIALNDTKQLLSRREYMPKIWDYGMLAGFEISGRHFRGPLSGGGRGERVRMSLVWISNTVIVSHFEEKAMSLSVFSPSLCRLSPFHRVHSSVTDSVKPYTVLLFSLPGENLAFPIPDE